MRLHKKTLGQRILDNWQLYLLLIIPVVITIIYKYIPMYGIQIAFRDYKPARGFFGSQWKGFYWFERFFTAPTFRRMIVNTVKLSLYSLLWSFPVPIILALAINQLRFKKYKRVVQTVLYAPHFISIMVVCGMIRIFLSPYGGLINLLIGKQVDFMTVPEAFRTIYISSGIWQDAGWGTIIYLATLSAVDPGLYEAAKIDGTVQFVSASKAYRDAVTYFHDWYAEGLMDLEMFSQSTSQLISKVSQGRVGLTTWWKIKEIAGDHTDDFVFLPPHVRSCRHRVCRDPESDHPLRPGRHLRES